MEKEKKNNNGILIFEGEYLNRKKIMEKVLIQTLILFMN